MDTDVWPFFALEVRTPRVTLRCPTDAELFELIEVAKRGVHDPATMPFGIPWTRAESPDLERNALKFHWSCRASLSPESFRIPLAVFVDGAVVGASDLSADGFPVVRQFETGSWLGLDHQGRGLGKELRLATLTLGFDGLDARVATTGAWIDNDRSLGVTRSLGYSENGGRSVDREGEAVRQLRFEMDAERFAEIRRDDITLHGVAGVRDFLGL